MLLMFQDAKFAIYEQGGLDGRIKGTDIDNSNTLHLFSASHGLALDEALRM